MRVPILAGIALFGLVTIGANVARADELGDYRFRPPTVKRFPRKIFLVGAAALALSKSWDAETTVACLNRSGACRESQIGWAVGPRPTPFKLASFDSSAYAATTTSFLFMEKSRKAWLRWTGRAVMAVSIVSATRMGFHNGGVCRR